MGYAGCIAKVAVYEVMVDDLQRILDGFDTPEDLTGEAS